MKFCEAACCIRSVSFGQTIPKRKGVFPIEPNWLKGPMPFELGMALVENPAALEKYAAMSRTEKQQFIDKAIEIRSRTQMVAYVQNFMSS